MLGFGNSGDVTAERVRVLDEVGAILGAEDAMHQVGSVGVRHAGMVMRDGGCHGDRRHIGMFGVPSLRDSGRLINAYPALKHWAKIFRPRAGSVTSDLRGFVAGDLNSLVTVPLMLITYSHNTSALTVHISENSIVITDRLPKIPKPRLVSGGAHCIWNSKSASAAGAKNLSPALQGGVGVGYEGESRRDGRQIIET